MADFSMDSWAEEYEITKETLDVLSARGFNSKRSLSKLTAEIVKKDLAKSLKQAQVLLLQDAVESLQDNPKQQQEPGPSTSRSTNNSAAANLENQGATGDSTANGPSTSAIQERLSAGDTLTANDILGLLQNQNSGQQGNQQEEAEATNSKAMVFDPLAFQPDSSLNQGKFRDIRSFISNKLKYNSEPTDHTGTVTVNGVALSLKDTKGPLESIKMSQYMEASLHILRAMVMEDRAGLAEVMDYIGYLTKFATLAQTFKWDSLLRYDYAYRKAQADMGFRWGADSPYLMQVHLIGHQAAAPGQDTNKGGARGRQAASAGRRLNDRNRFDPNTGTLICQKYNTVNGCDYRNCKYMHVCSVCYKNHPQAQHNQSNGNNKHVTPA